jgi:purine-nucleoside phosphorylase
MMQNDINNAIEYIRSITDFSPEIGLILGSGLGVLGEEVESKIIIDYKGVPNFPVSTVEGHKGRFVFGYLGDKKVAVMQGRCHFYEGYSMQQLAFPIRLMKSLGVKTIIVTNAAGGVNTSFTPGDLMIINDHINYMGHNPLIGPNYDEFGPRFPDMSTAYSKELIDITLKCAEDLNINVRQGVYMGFTGPSYETPAEIKAARILGADAVGMSTVPEVIAAKHCGIEVLGISCITNMAAGILDTPLNHEEVMVTAERVKSNFIKLIKSVLNNI